MTHPLVVNKRVTNEFDIYIGRPSRWGNDYSHLPNTKAQYQVATREAAIEAYRADLWSMIRVALATQKSQYQLPDLIYDLAALSGKKLGCWCAPAACHGEVLVAAAQWATEQIEALDKELAEQQQAEIHAENAWLRAAEAGGPDDWREEQRERELDAFYGREW